MTGDENKFPRRCALGAPLQEVIGVQRLSIVVVHTKQGHVQVVAGISEVIWIATKKRCLLLRSKHQAHISICLVLVKPIFAALIERHYVGTKLGLALFFNGRYLG